MTRHKKTNTLIKTAREILKQHHPMTVRQVYYQLVSRQVIKNNRSQYQAVSHALVDARKDGTIPWDWVEDRTRRPRTVSMWNDLGDFAETIRNVYRKDVWAGQGQLVEVWLEKDALSGIFEDALEEYGITLNVGRGYDGWDSIHNAAERYLKWEDNVTVLYFGDFDPSGEDMVRSLKQRLAFFGTEPQIEKCALTIEDIERYNLPPDFAKVSDTRSAAFIEKHGNLSVELDALSVDVLRGRLIDAVTKAMDLEALQDTRELEKEDQARIVKLLAGI